MEPYNLTPLDLQTTVGDISVQPVVFIYQRGRLDALSHEHQFVEIHYVLHGRVCFLLDGHQEIMEDGDLLIIGPGVCHSEEVLPSKTQESVCYSFSYKPIPKAGTDMDAHTLFSSIMRGVYYKKRISPEILSVIRQISDEYNRQQVACHDMLRLLIGCLTVETLRQNRDNKMGHFKPKNMTDQAEIIINEYFHLVFTGKTKGSAQELAEHLFISLRQLNRILQRIYGKNFSEMLCENKVRGAAWLLTHEGLSVAEVADRMGYCSPSAFCASFKKRVGVTPGQYRKHPFEIK